MESSVYLEKALQNTCRGSVIRVKPFSKSISCKSSLTTTHSHNVWKLSTWYVGGAFLLRSPFIPSKFSLGILTAKSRLFPSKQCLNFESISFYYTFTSFCYIIPLWLPGCLSIIALGERQLLSGSVEISSTNRAGCQNTECKDKGLKILKGQLRLGVVITIDDRQSMKWKHW